ncbi:MAG: glycosyltransferase [Bacteroidales bacterium]|nr:glycosyltransferase [Bacteroidales bacterium]
MKIYSTTVKFENGIKVKAHRLCGLSVWKKETGPNFKKKFLLNICISRRERNLGTICRLNLHEFFAQTSANRHDEEHYATTQGFLAELLSLNATVGETQIWFDHSWKGGTETYTLRQFASMRDEKLCIRLRGLDCNYIQMTYCHRDHTDTMVFINEDAHLLLQHLRCTQLVVNNMASYDNPLNILGWIKGLKEKSGARVSVRCHDFQYFCPNINMVNARGIYCNCHSLADCKNCYPKIPLPLIATASIDEWQTRWYKFLHETADEVLCFSHTSADIFTRLYPLIAAKVLVIPHKAPTLREVSVSRHREINIVVLGDINALKGMAIVRKIDKMLKAHPDVRMHMVGKRKAKLRHTHVVGQYDLQELPDIMERLQCDIVFIPSIWPETFSYTTAEAMVMGLPVACFDLGAPAERTRTYDKGLVISRIDAATALNEIVNFIEKRRHITRQSEDWDNSPHRPWSYLQKV